MLSSTVLQSHVSVDNTGISVQVPAIVTSDGILKSYLEYLLLFRARSQSWKTRSVFAMQLLLDYMDANNGVFDKPQKMFREFSNCLFTGTVGKNNNDPSGLYWKPRKIEDAKFLINLITHYTDWLSAINEEEKLQLNPFREASAFEQRLNWAAYCQKKDRSFMSHLWSYSDAQKTNARIRSVSGLSGRSDSSAGIFDAAKAFPKGKIDDLIHQGFVLPGKKHKTALHERLNLRDVLITLLMHFGGLRVSEVFHIFVEDIAILKDSNINYVVKVYHPEIGLAPTQEKETRKEYLSKRYHLIPRTQYPTSKRAFAGWKNPLLTNSIGKFFTVFFFPNKAGDLFFEYWRLYLEYQRVPPQKGAEHPYAFTSRSGSPHTISSYKTSLQRAVERIGLIYSKADSTTPHAHRHRYGQNLAEAGVNSMSIKTALHHRSIESQQTYTQPTEKEVRKQLASLEKNMATKPPEQFTYEKGDSNV